MIKHLRKQSFLAQGKNGGSVLQDFSNQNLAPQEQSPWRFVFYAAVVLFAMALYPISRANYLLFHNIVELTSIAVAITLFSVGWNTRQITRNDSFLLLAISFLAIAGLDLLHILTYRGMRVFPEAGVDPPTQFWVAARAMEACSYLAAACLLGRSGRLQAWPTLLFFIGIATLLGLSIWPWRIFPSCLVEGQGLTPFKIAAEYVICALLLGSGLLFWKGRRQFDPKLIRLLLLSIGLTILAEITFANYYDVYGINNFLGHLLKLASVITVYRALVLGALKTPYRSLFRELAQSHKALNRELAQRRRTEEQLRSANQELDAFVRTASHDLRAPLTVIIGGAELLQAHAADRIDSSHLTLLNNIEKQGQRMAKLLTDLLNHAQIGHLELPTETVFPSMIAAQAVADLKTEVDASQCPVLVEKIPSPGPPNVD